jgi:hypothetical protein
MTKIKNTKIVDGHIVCEGELIFLKIKPEDTINGLSFRKDNKKMMIAPMSEEDHKQAQYIKPVVISKTEEIEIGDKVLNTMGRKIIDIHTQTDADEVNRSKHLFPKVLVIPEQFSNKHLHSIESELLKEGVVHVKCETDRPENSTHYVMGSFDWTIQLINNKVELFNN